MIAGLAALLVLVKAFMAVLIVDAAGLWSGEGVVGFCYLDEFVMRGIVTSASW